MKKTRTVLTLLVITALLLAACGGGPTTQAPQATQAPVVETQAPAVTEAPQVTEAAAVTAAPAATAAATEAPAAQGGEVTLVVWDQFQREVESGVIDQLDKEFEADHPGVTIQRETKTLDDLKTTLKLALSQSDGPDVAQVNQGRSDMGALVQAGLLLPLNQYAEKYKWAERVSASISSRNSFTEDGKTFGQGNLYGVSPTAEVVGVYYNKGLFDQNGWQVPTTFDEFTQLLADIKATGTTPLAFGNLEGWPGIHEFSAVQHTLVQQDWLNNFVYGVNNVSFDTPENQEAARIMQDWVDQGYFTDGFMGIGYDDSTALFKSGQGAMMITGSWLAGELTTGTDQQFGFFLMPQKTADAKQLAVGGVGVPYGIRKSSANPDLAAEYLDLMVSPRAAQLWADARFVPAMPLPQDFQLEEGSLFADTVNAWNRINQDNGVGHYIDWASPTMYDTLVAELQNLFGKQSDPATFTAAVQADYAAFLETMK